MGLRGVIVEGEGRNRKGEGKYYLPFPFLY